METSEQKLKPTTYLDTGKLRQPSEAIVRERDEDVKGRPLLGQLTPAVVRVH